MSLKKILLTKTWLDICYIVDIVSKFISTLQNKYQKLVQYMFFLVEIDNLYKNKNKKNLRKIKLF